MKTISALFMVLAMIFTWGCEHDDGGDNNSKAADVTPSGQARAGSAKTETASDEPRPDRDDGTNCLSTLPLKRLTRLPPTYTGDPITIGEEGDPFFQVSAGDSSTTIVTVGDPGEPFQQRTVTQDDSFNYSDGIQYRRQESTTRTVITIEDVPTDTTIGMVTDHDITGTNGVSVTATKQTQEKNGEIESETFDASYECSGQRPRRLTESAFTRVLRTLGIP